MLVNYYLTGNVPYSHDMNDTYTVNGFKYKVHNLEKEFFEDFSNSALYKYNKSFLAICFYTLCCPFIIKELNCNYNTKCKFSQLNANANKKYDIIENSLFSALYNIINIYLKLPITKLVNWSDISKENLYIIRG